ncbi:MAG: mercury(II) reductase [Candidatus Dormibacteraeota bacterium]|nr:mercury(II) reductase [Candidatus Dormibacteraeota bacterium]
MRYDLAIVGSGGAGFAAAIAARSRGLQVLMIEAGTIGGTCVNVGCIPSKALLAAADARRVAMAQRFPGIVTEAGPVDMVALVDGKREIVDAMRQEKYLDLAQTYGWEIRKGRGRFVPGPALAVEGDLIEADHYLIATGSRPWVPPVAGLGNGSYLTSTTALELERVPKSLVVVGGNYVGLELGQLFARLGTRVTLVEALPRVAPAEEPEISAAVAKMLVEEGIEVITGAPLSGVKWDLGRPRLQLGGDAPRELRADQLLMATGRRPATEELGLEQIGVELGSRGEVVVDAGLRTTTARVWAAGDVTGAPQFVYVAGTHGTAVVENAFFGGDRQIDYRHLPRVTFTTPAIAAVGLTDQEAADSGIRCTCSVVPLAYVPRAIVNRDTTGVIKIVADADSRRVLGIHILADGAGDMVLAATYALEAGMTVDQLATTWCPYLTMAEAIKLAAQGFDRDVSKLSCCAS